MRPKLPGFQELVNEYKEELMRDTQVMKEIDMKIENKYTTRKVSGEKKINDRISSQSYHSMPN
ncbi:Fur-regulated basic protein B [Salinibacillus kushneri]|uniref:Fur-regulated basic protein B n=1 Tax=Salinibacillus kushneri TaxID=237682 RepID=A0A1I0I860_9BACI|nr:FbpB family small basic protein [Salinibacillus kushneri]SET92853.1 Fur-regulated basic protein B [Salinibacillus kushneri]